MMNLCAIYNTFPSTIHLNLPPLAANHSTTPLQQPAMHMPVLSMRIGQERAYHASRSISCAPPAHNPCQIDHSQD